MGESTIIPRCTSLVYLDKCVVCGKPASKKCAGCSLAFYCSAQHQRSDWPRHKHDCKMYEIQEVENIGHCLVSTKMIPAGTMLLAEYPIVIYEESTMDKLGCSSSHSLQKLLSIAEACPFKCPGCDTGWIIGNKSHACSKCGIPLCSKECEGSSTKHSTEECKALRDMGQREKRSSVDQMTNIWRDLIILRLLLQEQSKGSEICTENLKWAPLLKLTEGTSMISSENISELLPLSLSVLGKESATTASQLYQILQGCSISLDHICRRKRALYEKYSLLSHSCAPNTEWWIDNDRYYYKLIARCVRRILPGERITVNRCLHLDPSLLFNPTLTRRVKLQKLLSLDCRCDRCLDVLEKGTCISGVRCNICKDSLNSNYYFPTNPLDRRTSWTCSGKNCKATKTFEQILVVTVKAEKELEQIASTSTTIESVLMKLLEFIAKHQRKILHPCHYLIMIARSRVNKAVSCFLGAGEKLFLCVVSDQPRAYDYCSYKTDYLHAYLAFLAKIYDSMPERITGKVRYDLGFSEAALLFHDFEQERMGASTFFRRLHSITENLTKARVILSFYSDCSSLVEDIKKFSEMLRRLFGSDFLSSYRLKCTESSSETLKKTITECLKNWTEACETINLKRIYLNPESCHANSTQSINNNGKSSEMENITKQDLQMILYEGNKTPNSSTED